MDNAQKIESDPAKQVSFPDNIPNRRGPLDVAEAIKLRLTRGFTYEEIGNKYGVTKQAVFKAIGKFSNLLQDTDLACSYDINRETILNNAELTLLVDCLDADKREKASLNNAAYAFNIIHQANRLEKDKSTSNMAIGDVQRERLEAENEALQATQAIQALEARKQALLALQAQGHTTIPADAELPAIEPAADEDSA